MWLTGNKIRESVLNNEIQITPFHDSNINPNSYNYTLFPVIKRIKNEIIDLKIEDDFEEIHISDEGVVLYPGECYLGCTNEIFSSDMYASLVTGRSSIGRKFITNHVTAGLIDQGFNGRITLEITVVKPTRIYPNIPFGQIFWFQTYGDAILYNGRYQNQIVPQISKVSQNLMQSTKKKKLYISFSQYNKDFNFEDGMYFSKLNENEILFSLNDEMKSNIEKALKDNNVDRIELTGGQDPFDNPDIVKTIEFIKNKNVKIKIYTNVSKLIDIPLIDELNICFLYKKSKVHDLIQKLNFYRSKTNKLRLCIPITKGIDDLQIKEISLELLNYCDEIVFRPLTKDCSFYDKYKVEKNVCPSINRVKYDKLEKNHAKNENLLIIPK